MRNNTPHLSEEEKATLWDNYRTGTTHCYRTRCYIILLKSEGKSSIEVGAVTQTCAMTVNNWTKRYATDGISGLSTKKGRGRKSLINKELDSAFIIAAVQENRQRVSVAQAEWEAERGQKVHKQTFRNFLKTLVHDINESASVVKENPTPKSEPKKLSDSLN